MTEVGQNVTIYKGDTKTLVVSVYAGSALTDISGCVINYVVYRQTAGTIAITKTTASGVALTVPASGVFEIYLLPTDTENLLGYYLHECELTNTVGKVATLFTGKFTVLDSKA